LLALFRVRDATNALKKGLTINMKMKTRLILMSLLMGWLIPTAPAADSVAQDKIVEVARPPKFDLNFPGGPPA
jgi:hypothetical protein